MFRNGPGSELVTDFRIDGLCIRLVTRFQLSSPQNGEVFVCQEVEKPTWGGGGMNWES